MPAYHANRISTALILALVAATLALAASASASSVKLTVRVGTNKTYTRSQLHPGETVLCRYNGHTLSVTAPTGNTEAAGAGWPKPGTTDRSLFTLGVSVKTSRVYAVTCTLGGYHTALVTTP